MNKLNEIDIKEDHRLSLIDNFSNEHHSFNKHYPNNFRKSMIVQSSVEFEIIDNMSKQVKKLIKFIKENDSLSVNDFGSDFEHEIQKYYEVIINDKNLNLEFLKCTKVFFEKLTKAVYIQ